VKTSSVVLVIWLVLLMIPAGRNAFATSPGDGEAPTEDEALIQQAVKKGKLAPLPGPTPEREELLRLGQVLFTDPTLSGG